jgi:hypothetical protein
MNSLRLNVISLVLACVGIFFLGGITHAQVATADSDQQFGPVVRAYLGYLRDEQEVVDDRASRREISRAYYRRNSNRIRALREMAIKIARESHNDYLPELEAVAGNELGTLFERPPTPANLAVGKVYGGTFRFLGPVRSVDLFYVFARLDPYEQAEYKDKAAPPGAGAGEGPSGPAADSHSRPRRVRNPD